MSRCQKHHGYFIWKVLSIGCYMFCVPNLVCLMRQLCLMNAPVLVVRDACDAYAWRVSVSCHVGKQCPSSVLQWYGSTPSSACALCHWPMLPPLLCSAVVPTTTSVGSTTAAEQQQLWAPSHPVTSSSQDTQSRNKRILLWFLLVFPFEKSLKVKRQL